jgi:hypothetical protein
MRSAPFWFAGKQTSEPRIQKILPFYVPKPKDELYQIWEQQKSSPGTAYSVESSLGDDERVEDAGLEHEDVGLPEPTARTDRPRRSRAAA